MRSLALEAIRDPESFAELEEFITHPSQQHPDIAPLTARLLTAVTDCANDALAAPATPLEDAIRRPVTADHVKAALDKLRPMTPDSLASLRYSLIALDLSHLPALPVANLPRALIPPKPV